MTPKKYVLPLVFSMLLITGILIGNWYGANYSKLNTFPSILNKLKQSGDNNIRFSLLPRNNKISTILSYIENEYVDTIDISVLTEAAIPPLVEKLDPHSIYIPARELQKFNEPLAGNFSGIGIQFNMINDTIAIINTIPNGPSEIVGIQAGDRIILVDDSLVAGQNIHSNNIVKMLKGPKGTTVKVSIARRGEKELLEFEITRDDIPLYSVDVAYMISSETGYLKISTFAQTTYNEFIEGINKLHEEGMTELILDLRGNGGGLMDPAIHIADQFLSEGKLIVYTQGKSRPKHEFRSTAKGICKEDKVIILIDEFSASASEILAGALQDNDRGTIVGRRSFGKGLVQEQIEFKDGSALRLTIARYYTPTGRSIQKPYNENKEDYYSDIQNRFINHEFENSDSIHFTDSLKYITPEGKTVYGGGGIMPDVFIPLDTTGTTPYFKRVRNLGLIYRFAFDFTDEHRNNLMEAEDLSSLVKYLDGSSYFNDFISYAREKGVKPNYREIEISRIVISLQLKAYIARNIMDNDGFYPIIRPIDNTLLEAEKLFK